MKIFKTSFEKSKIRFERAHKKFYQNWAVIQIDIDLEHPETSIMIIKIMEEKGYRLITSHRIGFYEKFFFQKLEEKE